MSTHVLLTLSLTDPTEVPVGPIVDAHLTSMAEVYPEPMAEHDPVWVTPRAAQVLDLDVLDLLLTSAIVGLEGYDEYPDARDAALTLVEGLRHDVSAVRATLTE